MAKNKNTKIGLWLVILLGLGIGAYFAFLKKETSSTIDMQSITFAVPDTGAINKIFISTKAGKNTLLARQADGSWLMNDKYTVHPPMMINLMDAIRNISLRRPVGKNERPTVIKKMATKHMKVEIYVSNELIKTYYIGDETLDNLGNYFLLEGSETPYVLNIPGFNGYVSARFNVVEKEWRSRKLFYSNPSGIQEIKVDYPGNPAESFQISFKESRFHLDNPGNTDTTRLVEYILQFKSVFIEQFIAADMGLKYVDSVLASRPFAIVKLTDIDKNKSNILRVYGAESVDRAVAAFGEKNELVTIQSQRLEAMLKPKSYFNKSKLK